MSDPKPESDPTAAPTGQAAEGGAAPPQRRLAGLLRWALPLVCVFQTSLLASWLLVSPHGVHEPAEDMPKPQPVDKQQTTTTADAMQPDPRQGETHLREGNYALALPHFWPSAPAAKLALPDTVQFRAALCLEALGWWPEALEAYRGAVSKTANASLATAGQVAQARIHVRMNHSAEAKSLLFPLLLQSGQSDRYHPTLLIEARYLLGLALSQEAFADQLLPGLEDRPISANSATWSIGHTIDWLAPANVLPAADAVSKGLQGGGKLPNDLAVLRQYGPNGEEVLLRGAARDVALPALMEKLASLGKLSVVCAPQATTRLKDRKASLVIDGVPLLEIVHALLDANGLLWQVKEQNLRIAVETELSKEEVKSIRTNAARQALRQAMFAGPEHPLAATAYLELGNDEAVSGKLDEAVSWYERLLAESARSPHLSAAYYNLGLVQRARQNSPAARKAFYRVLDRDPGHELAPRALVQIGWTFLTDGQPLEAIFPLRQAVGMAQAPPADAEAVIALGTAYLLNGNALEANTILSEGRKQINRDPWRITAAFLDALARQRVAATGKKSRMESADLLAALLAFQNRPALASIGQLLAGQAFKELGMPQQMAKVFEDALGSAKGPVAAEMTYCLAEHHWSEGNREPALKLFHTLATSPQGKWGQAARMRLASVALEGGQPQQCLQACTALLHETEGVDRPAVLRLMGSAYEQLGDFQKAAQCYAGQAPD
ncbi:MAG TPA: tetratricopeptide repeat protein [Gemmataceae bacterium]|nr:tetratricopeptide repeat protein [Gemmataceae bacterium]